MSNAIFQTLLLGSLALSSSAAPAPAPAHTPGGPGAGVSLPPPVPPLSSSRFAMSPGSLGRKRLRDEGVTSDSGESDVRAASVNGSGSGGERKG